MPAKSTNKNKKTNRGKFGLNNYLKLFIILFSFILYGNTLTHSYSLDDNFVAFKNEKVAKGFKGIPEIFSTSYSEGEGRTYGYRPVAISTFAVEYALFGEDPGISHFINILLYALTGLFLFYLIKKLFPAYSIWLPFLTVLLFLSHPLHTEVVASLKNREELLSLLFSLSSMFCIIRYFDVKKWWYIPIALVFFIIAYLSKENAMVFILIIPLSIYFLKKEKLYKLLLVAFLLFLTFYMTRKFINQSFSVDKVMQFYENPLYITHSFLAALILGLQTLYKYFSLMVFPHPLLFYYGFDTVSITEWYNYKVIISLIVHLTLFVYAVLMFRKKEIISYGILFYLISISMFSNIYAPVSGIVAERLAYTASFGFCILLVFGLGKLLKPKIKTGKVSTGFIVVFILILIPFTIKTISRNGQWKDMATLLHHDINKLEKSARANVLYAGFLMEDLNANSTGFSDSEKKYLLDKTVAHYKKALEVYPAYSIANKSLGNIYFTYYKDNKTAEKYFLESLKTDSSNADVLLSLGYLYECNKNNEKAIKHYEQVIDIEKDNIEAYSLLSNMYFNSGDTKKAIELNQQIAEIDTLSDLPYINSGNFCLFLQDTLKAVQYWEKAIELVPSNPNLLYGLHRYFNQTGNKEKADYYLELFDKFKK